MSAQQSGSVEIFLKRWSVGKKRLSDLHKLAKVLLNCQEILVSGLYIY